MPDQYFMTPHRGQFMPYADPRIPETMTEPLKSLKPEVPQPINLWLHDDGLLHDIEPPNLSIATKWFQGGCRYGPLSAADITLITDSGYGAYITTDPNMQPQP